MILLIVGLGTIASIIYTRQSMELDKQRLAALNYCRQAMEIATAHATVSSGATVLVPFNTPGTEDLNSKLSVDYFAIPETGVVDWGTTLSTAQQAFPVLCRVQVTWEPLGSFYKMAKNGKTQKVSMYTTIRAGTL
jgi:hypothetical protein